MLTNDLVTSCVTTSASTISLVEPTTCTTSTVYFSAPPSVTVEKLDVKYHKEKTTVQHTGKYCIPGIKRVHFNGKACVILWEDDDKTVALCGEGETFDRYTGFMAAVCKKLFGGTTTAKKLLDEKDAAYQAQLKAEKIAKEKAERKAAEEKKAKKAHERKVKAQLNDLKIADEAYRRFKGEQ